MKQKLLRFSKFFIIVVSITIALLEIGLRVFGFPAYETPQFSMKSSPDLPLLPDKKMSARLNEGTFKITLNEGLTYRTTHLENGQRSCGKADLDSIKNPIKVAFYGCSFTYGVGVNDADVYPYILQQKFPSLKVENHGVPGYGQAQVLLELKQQSNSQRKPDVVILNYLSFHNERNSVNSGYQQKIRDGYHISLKANPKIAEMDYSYPFGSIKKGALEVDFKSIEEINSTLPLIHYSAIMNTWQNLLDKNGVNPEEDEKITFKMIDRIQSICDRQNINLVVSYMSNDKTTQRFIAHCKSNSIPVIDLFVDLSKKENSNAPFDEHPSANAHQQYAQKLTPFFNSLK